MTILQHVAFIMDGNRRWAKAHGLPILAGHRKGYKQLEAAVQFAKSNDIHYITFWAFSTENWNREKKEVEGLMNIFRSIFKKGSVKNILKENAKIVIFGDLERFPEDIQENVKKTIEESKNNTAITVNIALNYGGRAEILRAVNNLLKEEQKEVDAQKFSSYLYSAGQPDPDLIIRTGGEQRLSGYMPWQSIYSELYFTKTYWPDFDERAFSEALEEYSRRIRTFGK